ncbi:uncharacterized protein LOC131940892 [Physella acuta]|uniref:uncharacterized protein LOC131940892 n=1 Tax=Physella acuta TaxID=109671 RepID=UPI0027DB96F3|nr:uncharacterized protein LOC131940892 [Physella acuta]
MVDNSNFNFGLTYGFLLWDFYILGCVLCMWYSSGSKRHLRLFYTKWRQLSQEKATEELGLKPITCRRWRNRIMFVGCFNVLFNFGSFTAVLSLQEPTMVVTKANGVIPNNLKTIRIYHSKLCGVFYNYNKFLNYYLPLVYLVTIANSCLTLYNVIVHPNWSLVTLLNVLWLLVSLAICGVLSLSLSSVHEMAHSPLDKLYDLRETENSWPSQVIQIAGAYITYFMLLLQFRP